MGALFIAFEHELDDVDLSPHGEVLVEHEELLADIADELHVPPLMHFFHKSAEDMDEFVEDDVEGCLLYTSPSPRDLSTSRMPSSA